MSALKELVKTSDEVAERRNKAVKELDELRDALKQDDGESRDLTEAEEKRSDELISQLDGADKELDELDKRVKEETKKEKRSRRIAEARDLIKPADTSDAKVKDEPMVYGDGSPHSYVADLCRRAWIPSMGADGGAADRLILWSHQVEREYADGTEFGKKAETQLRETDRKLGTSAVERRMEEYRSRGRTALEDKPHETVEMRTGITTGGGATASASGGGGAAFVTPVFFVPQYAPYREYGRAFIDQCNGQPLPPYGMEVYMPAVEGPAEVASQTESSGVAEKVPTAGYLSGALKTEAGQVIVTQQLLDRAGPNFSFDKLIFDQLERDYAPKVDVYVLNEALTSPIVQNWSGNSEAFVLLEKEKAGGFYGQVAKAKGAIRTTSGTVLNPTHLFMAATRWEYIAAYADGNGRPLVVPDYAGPYNVAGGGSSDGDAGIEGATGYRFGGLPVFADQNLPAFGTFSSDQVIVGDLAEVYVYEGQKVPRVLPQTLGQDLQVILQLYAYITTIVRYPKAICTIRGTALKTPSYTN